MKLFKKLIALGVSTVLIVSTFSMAFAKPQSIYAPQNDPDGLPFQALQLGDWVVDSQGNYSFKYSVDPFKDQNAKDKGMIPYSEQNKGKYENQSKWAEYETIKAAKMGLSNMTFITQYQKDITRKDFTHGAMQMIYKYAKWIPVKKISNQIETDIFNDIDVEANPDDLALIHGYYLGIIEGYDGGFHPDKLITRQDMATILGRLGEIFKQNLMSNKDLKNYYADHKEIRSYAKKYVAGLSNDKIFQGYPIPVGSDIGKDEGSNYIFNPMTNTTYEQALVLLLRFAEKYLDPQVSHIIGSSINVNIDKTKLKWNAVYGADTYEVLKRKWTSDTATTLQSTTRTHSESMELEKYDTNGYPTCALGSGVYDFSIIPYNEMDAGLESEDLRVVVPHPVEKASIKITDKSDGTALLTWDNVAHFNVAGGNDVNGATKYRIVIKENGTNKVLEDKFVTEASNDDDVTTMTLNEPLVDTIGTYKVIIYAYNNDFASAPVTEEYRVKEVTIQEGTGEYNKVPKLHTVGQNDNNIQAGDYPIYRLNDDEFAYKYNDVYYRITDNRPMTNQQNINSLVAVEVNGDEIMKDVKKLVIEQI